MGRPRVGEGAGEGQRGGARALQGLLVDLAGAGDCGDERVHGAATGGDDDGGPAAGRVEATLAGGGDCTGAAQRGLADARVAGDQHEVLRAHAGDHRGDSSAARPKKVSALAGLEDLQAAVGVAALGLVAAHRGGERLEGLAQVIAVLKRAAGSRRRQRSMISARRRLTSGARSRSGGGSCHWTRVAKSRMLVASVGGTPQHRQWSSTPRA